MDNIKEKVYSFKTKYKEGFTNKEIEELLKDFPDINKDKFNNALRGITCMVMNKEIITYHCDIELAIRCGTENRNPKSYEWD